MIAKDLNAAFLKAIHRTTMILSLPLLAGAGSASAAGQIDFNRDIRPILSDNCFRCHGPDAAERKGGKDGLRLDTPDGAREDLGGYAAIRPGNPTESEMIRRITSSDPDEQMPPPKSGKRLSRSEVDLLTRWIQDGADYARHWSYVKPVRSPVPKVRHEEWPENPIDHFVLARLERENLEPNAPAGRYAIIRRLSLDLIGLPPTLEEVDQFVRDESPDAYSHLVDRLLSKKAFGEHWARMWLDLARYADSAGYADDPPRTIWAFRDYVIRSFNENKPFDQFTVEQIAGDLLKDPTEDQLIATAFHRNTLTNNEGGTSDEEYRNVAIVDRVNTTMAVWMGTTMACAQCHSHKYDPITQEEYFKLFAILNNTGDADRRDESPVFELFSEEQMRQKEQWELRVAELEKAMLTRTPELAEAEAEWEKTFREELTWEVLRPETLKTESGATASLQEDGSITVDSTAETDLYTFEVPLKEAGVLNALRLETLPDASLPGGGAGHAGGNFVVSRVAATVAPPEGNRVFGRHVRIQIPGSQKILSLAEVQVFSGAENVALKGAATQSSTGFDGPARYAIDGNTSGNYDDKSTTHTAISDDPWLEVDLQSTMPVDRIVLWNRTDNNLQSRLSDFRVALLDEDRNTVWEQAVKEPPMNHSEFALSGVRGVRFASVFADHSQKGFEAASVLGKADVKESGWAVAPHLARAHQLTLITASPTEIPSGSTLTVTIEQRSKHKNHTLGRFRLSVSGDARAAEYAKTPQEILAVLRTPREERDDSQRLKLERHFLSVTPLLQPARDELAGLRKQLEELKPYTTVPVMKELAGDKRRTTRLQYRGNFLDTGKEVEAGLPSAFNQVPPDASRDRLTLARWLVDRENPLTARVAVNRFWESIFGIGIVRTSEEFGSQGELPSHPELLDWLAVEFMESGWDMKHLLKLLVTSATYRQSSKVTPELLAADPDNRLLARGPRFRLSAEMIRDQAMFVSGLMSPKMYGPPVKPPQPNIGLSAAFGSGIDWKTSGGEDRYRRGLYTTWRRSNPYPSMAAFDAPNREVCTVRRERTNTPLQALVTLNDPVYVEAAQGLARRMVAAASTVAGRARHGFRLCLARPPSDRELDGLVALYERVHKRFLESPDEASETATEPIGDAPEGSDLSELAAWTVVGNVLLNLDETLMKR